jgi:hypothetical protein
MNTIRQAILDNKKLKLKPQMVKLGGKAGNKIIITPPPVSKQNLYHTIQHIKTLLPSNVHQNQLCFDSLLFFPLHPHIRNFELID